MHKIGAIRLIIGLIPFLIILAFLTSAFAAKQDESNTVGSYIYWDDGISLTGPASHVDLKIGGKINYDLGNINADEELQAAFPDFDGFHNDFRRLSVSLFGHAWDMLEFKFEVDFANVKDIKDQWLRFTKGTILPHFTFGYMKEPFSLEMLTSSTCLTFMEDTLPTKSFAPFRNFGVTAAGSWQEKRMTWAGGFFLDSGSYSSIGDSQNQISNANGYDLTGRITGLPIYRDEGRELIHLGLSYLHRFRNDAEDDPTAQDRTRPESRLTDDRLVDTSIFYDPGQCLVTLETAWMNGPLSIQGEYFHNFVNSHSSLDFNGWYLQGSWILTGENRKYQTEGGIFAGVSPEKEFRLGEGGWGALELALRLSRVDLNDKYIEGGKERNFTAGLNWYLRRKIRFMVNYIHVKIEDRPDPYIDNGRADIIMSRFQVNF
ncbi:MAG: porin [Thermodesulfobacteriota bacterium]|nr:porin [Thermodesulfobacteriota bacterium]